MPESLVEPMTILHVLPDLAVGGGQVLLLRQIKARGPGVTHHVVYVKDRRDMLGQFEAAGAHCHFVPSRRVGGTVRSGLTIARLAKSVGALVLHTNNTGDDRRPGMIAAWKASLPLVNTLHAEGEARGGRGSRGVRGWMRGVEDVVARRVTRRVVAVSRHVLSCWEWRLAEMGIGTAFHRVIHPGLDVGEFDLAAVQGGAGLRRELLRGQDGPLLVHVGRVAGGKGHRDLLPVMGALRREFPGALMLCVGDGPLRATIEAEVEALGLTPAFHFAGDRSDVPAILRVCDLMLFPSHSEGFGLAPLEAMAAGIAVVSNRLPSVAEFLGDQTSGVLVSTGDSAGMAGAAATLLRDRVRLARFGKEGRGIVERGFGVQRFVAEHEALYRQVVQEHLERKRA